MISKLLLSFRWYFSFPGKESACNTGDLGSIPGWEDALEKGMATHSNILAWRIPWTKETGRLRSMGSQRVGHNCATNTFTFTLFYPEVIALLMSKTERKHHLKLKHNFNFLRNWFSGKNIIPIVHDNLFFVHALFTVSPLMTSLLIKI